VLGFWGTLETMIKPLLCAGTMLCLSVRDDQGGGSLCGGQEPCEMLVMSQQGSLRPRRPLD
jgi:hypothetical protein